jgi:hypothetical protein
MRGTANSWSRMLLKSSADEAGWRCFADFSFVPDAGPSGLDFTWTEIPSHRSPPGATCISASSPHSLTCEIRVVHFNNAGCRVCWLWIHFASHTCMSVLFFNTPLIYIRVFSKENLQAQESSQRSQEPSKHQRWLALINYSWKYSLSSEPQCIHRSIESRKESEPKKNKKRGVCLPHSARSRAVLAGRFLILGAQFSVDVLCRGGKPQRARRIVLEIVVGGSIPVQPNTHTHRGVARLTDNSYMYALSSLTT